VSVVRRLRAGETGGTGRAARDVPDGNRVVGLPKGLPIRTDRPQETRVIDAQRGTNGNGPRPSQWGDAIRFLATGADTKGCCALLEITTRRGAEPPRHLHHREDQVVYVLEGDVTFCLEGEQLSRSAGTCVLLPAGREHGFAVDSNEARLLVIVAPAGLEDFYAALTETIPAGQPAAEWLVGLAARYGMEITGPPYRTAGS
jgi:quercetin dioxygenase-like cupin family protein